MKSLEQSDAQISSIQNNPSNFSIEITRKNGLKTNSCFKMFPQIDRIFYGGKVYNQNFQVKYIEIKKLKKLIIIITIRL